MGTEECSSTAVGTERRTVDTSAQTSIVEEKIMDTCNRQDMAVQTGQTEKNVMKCDWAYWYVPEDNKVKPGRITIRSKSSRSSCKHKEKVDAEAKEQNMKFISMSLRRSALARATSE